MKKKFDLRDQNVICLSPNIYQEDYEVTMLFVCSLNIFYDDYEMTKLCVTPILIFCILGSRFVSKESTQLVLRSHCCIVFENSACWTAGTLDSLVCSNSTQEIYGNQLFPRGYVLYVYMDPWRWTGP
jgi:hypothetical protein